MERNSGCFDDEGRRTLDEHPLVWVGGRSNQNDRTAFASVALTHPGSRMLRIQIWPCLLPLFVCQVRVIATHKAIFFRRPRGLDALHNFL